MNARSTSRRVKRGVIGVLSDHDRVLVIQRAACVARPGMWCFPGGHVELGETSKKAIVRELAEELRIRVEPTSRLGTIPVADSRHVLAVWKVELRGGEPDPNPAEVAAVRWLTPSEILDLADGLPSNQHVLDMLANG